MTIKTLTYIHRLLQAEEQRTSEAHAEARDLYYESDEQGDDPELICFRKEAKDATFAAHSAALDALLEFELQEW